MVLAALPRFRPEGAGCCSGHCEPRRVCGGFGATRTPCARPPSQWISRGVRVVAVVLIYFPKISLLEEKAEERLGSRSEVIRTTSLGLKEGISIPGVSPAPD